ncbi:MAG: glycosyltransferase [Tannerella sp.]|jgi:glycosyltransferase involved in cell wall biosynthesis|nr:glycosyltransferase [Tannerella sp.]
MPSPSFSIITVTYNAALVLEKTIKSVCSQSYRNIEYLIVDGASSDNTVNIATRYKEQITHLKRFEIVSEPDKGLYDAMNKGLRKASGDYVWFLNAGDILKTKDTVENIASICNQKNMPDIIYGETDLINSNGCIFAERRLKAPLHLTWKSFRMGMLVSHQAFIAKRNIAPEYDLKYHFSADFDWCIRCMRRTDSIVNSGMRLVNYQYEGTTTANRKASLKERYEIMYKYYGVVPTQIRHLWFATRFYWAKIFQKNS